MSRGPGRPIGSRIDAPRSVRKMFRVTKTEGAQIDADAKAAGLSVGAYIRSKISSPGTFWLTAMLFSDSSGCVFALMLGKIELKRWCVRYGYNTPAWQKQETRDWSKLRSDLSDMGLDFDTIQKK